METFSKITSLVNDAIYTYLLIPLLIGIGIYFTIKIKGGQFRNIDHAVRLITSKPTDEGAISPFKAFTISAASHIGTGNIVGVSTAITIGGPGAVFWMWITALIGGASSFIENTLGQIFKEKNPDGTFKGGPAYYMDKTLNIRALSVIFSLIVCIVYGFMFNAMQSNTIASGLDTSLGLSSVVSAVIVIILAGFVIFGGVRRIADITALLVPVMAIAYMLLVLYILITNISKVPHMFGLIFREAFSLKASLGGLIGSAVVNGVRRGLFSNEAGMGAVPNASAVADVSHPAKTGLIQALGVYLDTILVCSATAFVVIMAGEEVYGNPAYRGLGITQAAMATEVGPWAQHFLTVCVFLFALSSIIGNYYYGENNLNYLDWGKESITIYRLLVLAFVFMGAVGDFSIVWDTGDVFMGIMAMINLITLVIIGKVAIASYYDYTKQLQAGLDPVFDPDDIPELAPYRDQVTAWPGKKERN